MRFNICIGWRQYGVFFNHIGGCPTNAGLVSHISATGIPENNRTYCQSAACGVTSLVNDMWHCVANVYNGTHILAYVNGSLDSGEADTRNPFAYPNTAKGFPTGGIFAPPLGGDANFSVGAHYIHPGGGVGPSVIGNRYEGKIGMFAVYATALTVQELAQLCSVG